MKPNKWDEIFLELRLLREDPNNEWSKRFGEGFLEMYLKENFNPPTKINSDMINIKPLTLVKWDYESLPENWRKQNPNPYEGMTFMYFGEIDKMEGHSFLQCMKTGKPFILHTDELLPLTEDEI